MNLYSYLSNLKLNVLSTSQHLVKVKVAKYTQFLWCHQFDATFLSVLVFSLPLPLFTCSPPWLPSVTVTDDWTSIRRESQPPIVSPRRELMSALDQKSREATLPFGWGEGEWGPWGQASEDGMPSHPSHSISCKTETCTRKCLSSACLFSFSSLFFVYFFIQQVFIEDLLCVKS